MSKKYIYNMNYQVNEKDLCQLELRSLFKLNVEGKVFFSEIKVDPTLSPFLKNRLEILYKTTTFSEIVDLLEKSPIIIDDFKVKYLKLTDDDPHNHNRRELCKELGLKIQGVAKLSSAKTSFGISFYEGNWYFGELVNNTRKWQVHQTRPHSYSSSLGIHVAKALINIASNGDLTKRIIDPCCGVGTVLLEGIYGGFDIRGRELNWKVAENARNNLLHFNYLPKVTTGDIQDITDSYDVSIIDLPYGIVCKKSEENQQLIIKNAKRISKRVVFISSVDIRVQVSKEGLKVIDSCKIKNERKGGFSRRVLVCE